MPSESWEEEAMRHVDAMAKYHRLHAISSEVLAKDPTERNRMAEDLRNSTDPHVRHELSHDPNEDFIALLRGWDEALTREATTFQEHFLQLQYATIASIYYDRYILSVAIQKHGPKFNNFYRKNFINIFDLFLANLPETKAHLNSESQHRHAPSQSSPPPDDLANLDVNSAKTLLASPEELLSIRFYLRDEGIAGFWSVETIHQKRTRHGTSVEFKVAFEGDEEQVFEVTEKEVIDLLLASAICATTL